MPPRPWHRILPIWLAAALLLLLLGSLMGCGERGERRDAGIDVAAYHPWSVGRSIRYQQGSFERGWSDTWPLTLHASEELVLAGKRGIRILEVTPEGQRSRVQRVEDGRLLIFDPEQQAWRADPLWTALAAASSRAEDTLRVHFASGPRRVVVRRGEESGDRLGQHYDGYLTLLVLGGKGEPEIVRQETWLKGIGRTNVTDSLRGSFTHAVLLHQPADPEPNELAIAPFFPQREGSRWRYRLTLLRGSEQGSPPDTLGREWLEGGILGDSLHYGRRALRSRGIAPEWTGLSSPFSLENNRLLVFFPSWDLFAVERIWTAIARSGGQPGPLGEGVLAPFRIVTADSSISSSLGELKQLLVIEEQGAGLRFFAPGLGLVRSQPLRLEPGETGRIVELVHFQRGDGESGS